MPYEFNDDVWISVTIEMSLDLFKYDRQMYTIFDMLSDVGGLSGIIITVTSIFLKVWNRHSFESYMASRLFKINKP